MRLSRCVVEDHSHHCSGVGSALDQWSRWCGRATRHLVQDHRYQMKAWGEPDQQEPKHVVRGRAPTEPKRRGMPFGIEPVKTNGREDRQKERTGVVHTWPVRLEEGSAPKTMALDADRFCGTEEPYWHCCCVETGSLMAALTLSQ
jgi:hypothetical protein